MVWFVSLLAAAPHNDLGPCAIRRRPLPVADVVLQLLGARRPRMCREGTPPHLC
ncbi:hypothetical protein FOCC_FOCC012931, partial [Frankliniella occidentalis]